MRALGPFDKRRQTSRCHSCATRHLKVSANQKISSDLQGNLQHDDSVRMTHLARIAFSPTDTVNAAEAKKRGKILVDQSEPDAENNASVSIAAQQRYGFYQLTQKQSSYITYFFSTFLPLNDLTGSFGAHQSVLMDLASRSDTIVESFVAVAALHVSRPNSKHRDKSQSSNHYNAVLSYQKCVSSLRSDLGDPKLALGGTAIWTTFFLGIFEVCQRFFVAWRLALLFQCATRDSANTNSSQLMYDVTGDGWANHMLHGTSRLLSLREPHEFADGSDRNIYLTVRVHEVIRALSFHDATFLDQARWHHLKNNLWLDQKRSPGLHPLENLIGLMTSICGLLDRYHTSCRPRTPHHNSDYMTQRTQTCYNADRTARSESSPSHLPRNQRVPNPKPTAQLESRDGGMGPTSPELLDLDGEVYRNNQTLMGKMYYHAMMIYLPAMFNPRWQIWQDDRVKHFLPLRSPEEVDAHVQAILELADAALQYSTLAGALLYLPIRIAGQRCKSDVDRLRVHRIVSQVADRGFVVVNSLIPLLERSWALSALQKWRDPHQ